MARANNPVLFLDYVLKIYPFGSILKELILKVEMKLTCEIEVEIHEWDSLWWRTRGARGRLPEKHL